VKKGGKNVFTHSQRKQQMRVKEKLMTKPPLTDNTRSLVQLPNIRNWIATISDSKQQRVLEDSPFANRPQITIKGAKEIKKLKTSHVFKSPPVRQIQLPRKIEDPIEVDRKKKVLSKK
jgi:hypothetical protein